MIDTLFGLIPTASRGQQWVADELQLVNWGGYDGPHRMRFSPDATLLCGGSGSGKSTLMDGYIALMMPHNTPFNGASNGAVTGRPRGKDQRNVISYGRGKLDETRTEDGTKVTVLRGDGEDTWTAVAMTWVDHDGSRFTAVRAWYIPANARTLEDTVKVRATVAGAFNLSSLTEAADHRLSDASVRATGLETVATDREFSARLHNILGIGAAGAGAKAISLLARIQAGQQITTVDELYKRMVLEEPATLATADAVVDHFDGLASTRERMLTAQQQVRALEPIRAARARIETASVRLRLLGELGRFAEPTSLASLWRAWRRLDLLRDVETEQQTATRAAEMKVREAEALADAADGELDALREVLRASGGDRLEAAERELRALEKRASDVERDRMALDDALIALQATVKSKKDFDALARDARAAIADPDAKAAARSAYAKADRDSATLEETIAALETARDDAATRTDSIPDRKRIARDILAHAAGLPTDALPFVGELIEVRTEFEPWREAFNLALGGFATTLLIDAAHLPAFRTAINSVPTRERLSYEGVHTGLREHAAAEPHTLPGRLEFKQSPFTGWLQDELDRRFKFVCVDSPRDLAAHSMALTITGQVARGSKGAHGGHGRDNVLGFSTHRLLDDISARMDAALGRRDQVARALNDAIAALDELEARQTAYGKVLDLTWERVDTAAVEADRKRWNGIIDEVTSANPKIAQIQKQIEDKRARAGELREAIGAAKAVHESVSEAWAATTDQVDAEQSVIEAADEGGRALTDDQATYLDGQFLVPDLAIASTRAQALTKFDAALDGAQRRFADDQLAAQTELGEQRRHLAGTLATFLDRWPNPNLTSDPDTAVDDFERILVDLETSGLHNLEAEWRDSLVKLSGNDLTNLDSTLSRSLREIRDRIEPINQIMEDLPFYDDDHRLQITPRDNQSEVRRRFRKELRDVRAAIDAAETDQDRERVYVRMAKLIDRLRRTAPDFADLVDVRNHVRVSAERVDAATRKHVALYDHIGEKSGGESQELIAFIVGAALRYQLGDAGAERPRYAPVFLDEALIKADAHFTKRAIGAWRGLGFQLIIGAPNDKYSAIEPHVDVEYDILKDVNGRSWAKPKVALPAVNS